MLVEIFDQDEDELFEIEIPEPEPIAEMLRRHPEWVEAIPNSREYGYIYFSDKVPPKFFFEVLDRNFFDDDNSPDRI